MPADISNLFPTRKRFVNSPGRARKRVEEQRGATDGN
jgi:hypothetical protein